MLWIRIDPDMQLLRQVVLEQPDYQWQSQMRYERDVTAQYEAITQLERFHTNYTKKALTEVIENDQCFYRIRCEATLCLRTVTNHMASLSNAPVSISFFDEYNFYVLFSPP